MAKGNERDGVDYVKIYSLEQYLFEIVGPQFEKTGEIDPADFYMIVIWKANRAKTRIKRRLDKKAGNFTAAVKAIASSLHRSDGPESRLKVLMTEWKFRLPMATAILTVLYPSKFTVYDIGSVTSFVSSITSPIANFPISYGLIISGSSLL